MVLHAEPEPAVLLEHVAALGHVEVLEHAVVSEHVEVQEHVVAERKPAGALDYKPGLTAPGAA